MVTGFHDDGHRRGGDMRMLIESRLQGTGRKGKRWERGARSPRVQRQGRRGPGKLEAPAIGGEDLGVYLRYSDDGGEMTASPQAWLSTAVEDVQAEL